MTFNSMSVTVSVQSWHSSS